MTVLSPLRAMAFAATALLSIALLAAAPHTQAQTEARTQTDAPTPIFYNITTDDEWAAGMALAQANVAASRGHKVTVFLNVRGVRLANRNAAQRPIGPAKKTAAQLIHGLVAKNQSVLVCGGCMGVVGLSKDELIEGATVASPETVFGALTAPGAIALSY